MPMRRARSVVCASTGNGHATTEPAAALMKSRRRTAIAPNPDGNFRTNIAQGDAMYDRFDEGP